MEPGARPPVKRGITPHLTRMLDSLISHDSHAAGTAIAQTIGEAERRARVGRRCYPLAAGGEAPCAGGIGSVRLDR